MPQIELVPAIFIFALSYKLTNAKLPDIYLIVAIKQFTRITWYTIKMGRGKWTSLWKGEIN